MLSWFRSTPTPTPTLASAAGVESVVGPRESVPGSMPWGRREGAEIVRPTPSEPQRTETTASERLAAAVGLNPSPEFTALYERIVLGLPPGESVPLIGFLGGVTGDGVTSTLIATAASAAGELGQKLLLIEADPGHAVAGGVGDVGPSGRSLQARLGVPPGPGWQDALAGRTLFVEGIQPTAIPGVEALLPGPRRPGERWQPLSAQLREAIERLPVRYDAVLIDLGSLDRPTADRLLPALSGVVLVLGGDRDDSLTVTKHLERLQRQRVVVLGAVLSPNRRPRKRWFGWF